MYMYYQIKAWSKSTCYVLGGRETCGRALEEKRKRTVSEREEEDDGTLVGPLPVEHSADDMQAAKKVKRES